MLAFSQEIVVKRSHSEILTMGFGIFLYTLKLIAYASNGSMTILERHRGIVSAL